MTYNVFSGTLNPTYFTLLHVVIAGETCHTSLYSFNFDDTALDGVVPH